jgi:hypothetical protein
VFCFSVSLFSQTFPTPDYFRRVWSAQAIPETIAGPEKLRDYVKRLKMIEALGNTPGLL